MSRSDKSDGKKLLKSENKARCPSSSSSSNSNDGDVIRNASKVILSSGRDGDSLKGGSEAPSDVFYGEYLGGENEESAVAAYNSNWLDQLCRVPTEMKIVRLKKLDSDDSEVLLIFDLPRRRKVSSEGKATKQDEREKYRSGCKKGLRKRYDVSHGLAKKSEELRLLVSEERSLHQPSNASKFLPKSDRLKPAVFHGFVNYCTKNSTSFKRNPETNQFEPVRKKLKNVPETKTQVLQSVPLKKFSEQNLLRRRCLNVYDSLPFPEDCPVYLWSHLDNFTEADVSEDTAMKWVPKTLLACRESAAASFRTLVSNHLKSIDLDISGSNVGSLDVSSDSPCRNRDKQHLKSVLQSISQLL